MAVSTVVGPERNSLRRRLIRCHFSSSGLDEAGLTLHASCVASMGLVNWDATFDASSGAHSFCIANRADSLEADRTGTRRVGRTRFTQWRCMARTTKCPSIFPPTRRTTRLNKPWPETQHAGSEPLNTVPNEIQNEFYKPN